MQRPHTVVMRFHFVENPVQSGILRKQGERGQKEGCESTHTEYDVRRPFSVQPTPLYKARQ
jgi:hypothetical protein